MNPQSSQHEEGKTGRPLAERRKKERKPARGEVRFLLGKPAEVEVRGRLIDASDGAFRAAHQYTALCAGQEVSFRHPTARGTARVIWNRILNGEVETGFLIL